MTKLLIKTENRKWFEKLFRFFVANECELCLFPDGLRWRNHEAEGIVYSKAFAEYPFNYRRKIGTLKGIKLKELVKWFDKDWKERKYPMLMNDNKEYFITEIPIK